MTLVLHGSNGITFPDGRVQAVASGYTIGAAQATTSGTSVTVGSIPSGTREILIIKNGISLSGTDNMYFQIGDAGGLETSGYAMNGVLGATTSAFGSKQADATGPDYEIYMLQLYDVSAFTWYFHLGGATEVNWGPSSGFKSLSAELTQLKLFMSGSNTFDAGAFKVLHK